MEHGKCVGRVSALAFALGLGWAVATAPAVAHAEPAGPTANDTSVGSADTAPDTTPGTTADGSDTEPTAGSPAGEPASAGPRTGTGSAGADGATGAADDDDLDLDAVGRELAADEAAAESPTESTDSTPGTESPEDEAAVPEVDEIDGPPARDDARGRSAGNRSVAAAVVTDAPTAEPSDTDTSSTDADPEPGTDDLPGDESPGPLGESEVPAVNPAPAARTGLAPNRPDIRLVRPAQPRLHTLLSNLVAGVLAPLSLPVPATPLQPAVLTALLATVRDELERAVSVRQRNFTALQTVSQQSSDTPNVLVIGVDGVTLSRILADPQDYPAFIALMGGGTTAASTIAGHTTLSNPSWTTILTGVWGERTGVINNVFTPWTYDRWPTVFTQLERLDPLINTTAIANWDVIAAIAGSGAIRADNIYFVPQLPDDPNWLLTDDAVGAITVNVIEGASPDEANFVFSYFVGVDENGHMYGGDSPEYAAALRNLDANLAAIMAAIEQWESVNGESWTVVVVTDHGHQPQLGLGHGFQSPPETTTFVIARGEHFTAGAMNNTYRISDVTPTVLTLFGGTPAAYSDGVPLMDRDGHTVPIGDEDLLIRALRDAAAMYGFPDIPTDIALGIRTVFASIPYFIDLFTDSIVADLQAVAEQDIFLVSALAALAVLPVQFTGDVLYVTTNVVAQIVAWLTGVSGASIFPLLPPPPPGAYIPQPPTALDLLTVAACPGDADQPAQCAAVAA